MEYLLIVVGLLALLAGGEALVRGSVGLARWLGLPPFLIGLTVVGFGTSMPELLVSVDAALRGVPDIAVGNVVGSNIANILLIAGLTAVVRPIPVSGASIRRDALVMLGVAVLLVAVLAQPLVSSWVGAGLVAILCLYLGWAYKTANDPDLLQDDSAATGPVWVLLVFLAVGLAALLLGARFLVDGAVTVARTWGLSEAFIGLTVVAVGTSLPELATSLMAAVRKQSEIALGNIIGSNIFNVLGILGVTAMITPIPVAARFVTFDMPVLVVASLVFVAALYFRPIIGRILGAAMLIGYGCYIVAAQG